MSRLETRCLCTLYTLALGTSNPKAIVPTGLEGRVIGQIQREDAAV